MSLHVRVFFSFYLLQDLWALRLVIQLSMDCPIYKEIYLPKFLPLHLVLVEKPEHEQAQD